MDLTGLGGVPPPPLAEASIDDLAKLAAEHALGRDMLSGYVETYRGDIDRYEVVAVEKSFALRVRNPESERASSYFDQAGVVDLVVRDRADGRVLVMDHKTAAPGSIPDLVSMLRFDPQASLYCAAWGEISGSPPDGFCLNVLAKRLAPKPPRLIKPKKKADACPCGIGEPHTLSRDKSQATTGDLYREAIRVHGLVEADYSDLLAVFDAAPPVRYVRESVTRTPEQLRAWQAELYETSREIRTGRIYRNPRVSECPRCPFLPLCTMDTPEARTLYRVAETPHEEIDGDEAMPLAHHDVISQSRLRSWYQCRQREAYTYRELLRPVVQSRALAFGTGIHLALAEWYRSAGRTPILDVWESWYSDEYLRLTGERPTKMNEEQEYLPF